MSPHRRKWLIRLSMVLVIVGLVLILVSTVLAKAESPTKLPARPNGSWVPYTALTNNTASNDTGNKTIPACTPQANDYCYRSLVQLWGYTTDARNMIQALELALAVAVGVIALLIAALFKYSHDGVKAAKETRLAPDRPEAIAETGALFEFVAPSEMKAVIRHRTQRLMAEKEREMQERREAENREA